jgi:5-enolpyruvylshikimate-3-phosphate synthase
VWIPLRPPSPRIAPAAVVGQAARCSCARPRVKEHHQPRSALGGARSGAQQADGVLFAEDTRAMLAASSALGNDVTADEARATISSYDDHRMAMSMAF